MQTYVKEAGWIGTGGEVMSHPNSSTQESITLSEQLLCTRVIAFSPTSLF